MTYRAMFNSSNPALQGRGPAFQPSSSSLPQFQPRGAFGQSLNGQVQGPGQQGTPGGAPGNVAQPSVLPGGEGAPGQGGPGQTQMPGQMGAPNPMEMAALAGALQRLPDQPAPVQNPLEELQLMTEQSGMPPQMPGAPQAGLRPGVPAGRGRAPVGAFGTSGVLGRTGRGPGRSSA